MNHRPRRPGVHLLARCAPPRRQLTGLLGWSAAEAGPALVTGLALARAVDAFRSGDLTRALAWLLAPTAALVVGAWASTRLYRVLALVVEEIRDRLSRAVVDGELGRIGLGGRRTGAPVTQLTDQIEEVRNLLSALLRTLRGTVSPLVAAALGLTLLNPLLALAVIAPTLAGLLLYAVLLPATVARTRDGAVAEEVLGDGITELFGALPQLRGLGVSRWAADRLAGQVDDVAAAQLRLAGTQSARRIVLAVGAHGPLLAVLLAGAELLPDGRVSVGDLVGATTYVLATSAPALRALVGAGGGWLVQLLVLLDRLAAVADVPDGDPDARSTRRHERDPDDEDDALLVAGRLSFSYRPQARPVLDRLCLRLRAGELLAVAGPSGTGKSTFARLVAGTIAPTAGTVSVSAGVRTCLLPQEAYVFTGSLRENLAYLARGPVADARLAAAVTAFGLGGLVDRLGDADTVIGTADLNPAERQQVVLARAFLSEADLVVLDEATCHLDAAAEAAAEAAFRAGGRTLIVIAHRLDVTDRADRVLWLDGVTAVSGTRGELVAGCAPFADLVRVTA